MKKIQKASKAFKKLSQDNLQFRISRIQIIKSQNNPNLPL